MSLTNKQIRILQLLDDQILSCKRCSLYSHYAPGGVRCKPYWTAKSKYIIIGEAPGREEVIKGEPFIGQAGRILWETVWRIMRISKESFAIINSVNCRPTDGTRNLKPTPEEQGQCFQWIRKFIKIIQPEKILILGNYAMGSLLGKNSGITRMNGTDGRLKELDNIPYVISVHPAYCIYNQDEGKKKLGESITNFKDLTIKPTQLDFFDDGLFEI